MPPPSTSGLTHRIATARRRPRPGRVPVWLAIVAASLPMFMATLDNLVMTSALPVIRADLGSTVGQLSWFMNAYTLTFATFMLPAATLGDRLGRRRVMLAGLAVFTLASIASALSTTSEALIAARAVQGLGAAAIMPLSLTLLASAVPAGEAGRRHRHLGRRLRPRRRARPGDRRRRRRGRQLAGDLLAQRPRRPGRRSRCCCSRSASRRGTWQRLDLVGTLLLGGAVFLGIWGIVHGNDDGWT